MAIDDTKKCICKPALSGRNPDCLRCHPKKVIQVKVVRAKPAQEKKHHATKAGQLPWLKTDDTTEDVAVVPVDPYAEFDREE